MKKNFLFLFYLLAGILVGSLIASVCAGVPFLSWLAYAGEIGFAADNPARLDLIILVLRFGFSLRVSIAQILCVGFAIFLYNRTRVR